MTRTIWIIAAAAICSVLAYFALWPVPIEPVAWTPPPNPGFKGVFAPNRALRNLELVSIGADRGPEDIARDGRGFLYTGTRDGNIIRLDPDGGNPSVWARTGGKPLGLAFAPDGRLIIADAYRGVLAADQRGRVSVVLDKVDGEALGLADDVAVAQDGTIYISDASAKFPARRYGGAGPASIHEILEHGGTGRVLAFNPREGRVRVLMKGLTFANGIELSKDEDFLLINESGAYTVHRYWLKGPRAGRREKFLGPLPSFPDNVDRGSDGLFWIALITPRNADVDALADNPFARKMISRLPRFLQPAPTPYLHVIAVDEKARVVHNLQDPLTKYFGNTAVLRTEEYLFFGSLESPTLARVRWSEIAR